MTMVTVKPVGLQEWQATKAEFVKAVKQAVNAKASILQTPHTELSSLFRQAQKELTAMGQARACNSSPTRLWSISFLDTAVFAAGAVGYFLSDTEIAKDYPWLKVASLCAIAAAHCFSKINDIWNYVGIRRSKRELELTLIVRDGLFLKAADTLMNSGDTKQSDWGKEKKGFLELVCKKNEDVTTTVIGMTEDTGGEDKPLLAKQFGRRAVDEDRAVSDETTV